MFHFAVSNNLILRSGAAAQTVAMKHVTKTPQCFSKIALSDIKAICECS